ncbi:competence/damage-inducible protein A, partial [Escherichia coli]|nr:competence/damage-inducible protein A [Escherichia coli]
AQTAHWITERRAIHFSGLAPAVLCFGNQHLNLSPATPDGHFALRRGFSTTRHSLALSQGEGAMMAPDMSRPWLKGQDIASGHGMTLGVESMTFSC